MIARPSSRSVRSSKPRRLALLLAAAAAAAAPAAITSASVVDVSWTGGTGNWWNASMWSPAVVPFNNGTTSYNAIISSNPQNPAYVTLDAVARVDSFSLSPGSTLNMPGHALSLDGTTSNNSGTITINNAGIYGNNDLVLGGTGTIEMAGSSAILSPGSATLTIGAGQTVQGQGSIQRAGDPFNAAIINNGTIDAVRGSATETNLAIYPTRNGIAFENHGTMQASRTYGSLFLGTGTYDNHNGTIQSKANFPSDAPDVFIQRNSQVTGGTLAARGGPGATLRIDTGCTVSDATLSAADGALVRIDTGGTLNGSTLSASGAGSGVRMLGTTLNNCTFTTSTGGANILLNAGSISPTLTNTTNRGLLQLGTPAVGTFSATPANATLVGSVTNDGTIAFTNFVPSNAEFLTYRGDVTLGGSGTLTMISGAWNYLTNSTPGDQLTNGPSHTIDGVGQIVGSLVNHGVVNARRIGGSSTTTLLGDLQNDGTMQAQTTAVLDFQNLSSARNDGTIQTVGSGRIATAGVNWTGAGHWIADGGTIGLVGGTISTTGSIVSRNGGAIDVRTDVVGSSNVTLDGGTIIDEWNLDSAGSISLRNGSHLLVNPGATLGAAAVSVESNGGSLEFNGVNVTAPTIKTGAGGLLVNTAGNSSVQAIDGGGQTTVLAGSLTANYFRQKTLQVNGRATVRTSDSTPQTSRVDALVMNDGTLDLNKGNLIVTTTPKSDLELLVNKGRNGGDWNGAGITSSVARMQIAHATTLGVLSGSEYKTANGTNSFGGFILADTDTLVKYTWYGDTDLNGTVNFDDYVRADNGFNNHLTGWMNGDFDLNGAINFDDYVLIDLAFNSQDGTLGRALSYLDGSDRSASGMADPALRQVEAHLAQFGDTYAGHFAAAVPEPAAIGVAGVMPLALALARRRRRR